MTWEQQPGYGGGYGPPQQPQQPQYPQQPYGYDGYGQPQPYGQPQQPYPYQQPQQPQQPYQQQQPPQYVDYGQPVYATAPLPVVEPEVEPEPETDSGPEPVAEEVVEEAPESTPAPKPAGRDRYFDTLRAVALIRVVTYHTFGWAWCGMVFPSMGIMFGLAGTLMAKSLERPAFKVVKSRMRRLLPPFWFWGFFVVVAMMIHDWMPGWQIVFWVVPVGDPPGNAWGLQAWEILWYLRTYLWFVLLSPALLWIFRKAPIPVLLLTLVPIVVLKFVWSGPDNRFGNALWDLSTYLFCWILGFAHRDGVLQKLKPFLVVTLSVAAIAFGGWYAFTHQAEAGGTYDLDESPLAQTYWSAGYVMLLMWAKAYFNIDFAWLTRFKRLDRVVTIFNSRAVTIYLWHEIALVLAVPLTDQFWKVPAFEKWLPLGSQWFMFGIGWILIALFIVLCGWVEDVAAKKKPQLLPS
ncbi:acyltransferase [Streptomyces sp. MBT53]|uniref:acyltransferase family protein n=1 Tax=Streptomyces sp. MBT53 TaxID=1488384 RepID=UPI0019140337|nr:acyltransferase [Streptomyces sp. MBT53]MBK6010830.1 acyltransferase [Streptomyces sp. MBT53]